jgi:hypothetical protein
MRWPRHADSPSRRLRTRDFCCTKSSLATRARTPERSRVGKTLSARSICSTRFRDFGVGMTGSLMTPFLVIIFGIHPATTMGTDLLYAAATKSAGTLIHGLHSAIDWRVVGRLAGRRPWCSIRDCRRRALSARSIGIARVSVGRLAARDRARQPSGRVGSGYRLAPRSWNDANHRRQPARVVAVAAKARADRKPGPSPRAVALGFTAASDIDEVVRGHHRGRSREPGAPRRSSTGVRHRHLHDQVKVYAGKWLRQQKPSARVLFLRPAEAAF